MDVASAIRQQAEDLQEEIKELNIWQEEILRQQEANKNRKVHSGKTDLIPPIRGTVPSLKEAILNLNEKNEEEDPVKKAKENGNEFFQSGKLKEAIDAYSTGIDLDSEGPMAHVLYGNRALCYLKLDKWEDAERDASSCVRLNHSYSKGYFRRAMARKQLGNLKGARTDLEAVLALLPNDISATNELKLITQMIQLERENSGQAVKKKKIVIAEIDDDDDDNNKNDNDKNVDNMDKGKDDPREIDRKEQLNKELQELEQARTLQRNLQESKARKEEENSSQKRRTCTRVEVIEDEPTIIQSEISKSEIEVQKATSNQSTINSNQPSVAKNNDIEHEKRQVIPRTFKAPSKWSKDTLKVPRSFTEFERIFSDIRDNEELCCFYISLIPPEGLRTLFGNNMTPDILIGILRVVKQLPGTVAISFLKGLCTVKRVKDISLFFDSSEKKVVEEVLDILISCGASDEDVNLFKQQLKVA